MSPVEKAVARFCLVFLLVVAVAGVPIEPQTVKPKLCGDTALPPHLDHARRRYLEAWALQFQLPRAAKLRLDAAKKLISENSGPCGELFRRIHTLLNVLPPQ